MNDETDEHLSRIMVRTARAALRPIEPMLAAAVRRAWQGAQANFRTFRRWPRGRVRANDIQERLVHEVQDLFPDRVVEKSGRSLLHVSDNVVAHFKKLDEHGRSRNLMTQTALAFAQQVPLPSVPPGVRVTVGYLADRSGREMLAALASIVHGDVVLEMWELDEAASAPAPVTPITPPLAPPPAERKRGRLRRDPDGANRRSAGDDGENGGTG